MRPGNAAVTKAATTRPRERRNVAVDGCVRLGSIEVTEDFMDSNETGGGRGGGRSMSQVVLGPVHAYCSSLLAMYGRKGGRGDIVVVVTRLMRRRGRRVVATNCAVVRARRAVRGGGGERS